MLSQLEHNNKNISQLQRINEQQTEFNKNNQETITDLRKEKDDLQTRLIFVHFFKYFLSFHASYICLNNTLYLENIYDLFAISYFRHTNYKYLNVPLYLLLIFSFLNHVKAYFIQGFFHMIKDKQCPHTEYLEFNIQVSVLSVVVLY